MPTVSILSDGPAKEILDQTGKHQLLKHLKISSLSSKQNTINASVKVFSQTPIDKFLTLMTAKTKLENTQKEMFYAYV